MALQESAVARAARLPSPAAVLATGEIISPRGTTYRVLKTRELDPYERQPVAPAELAAVVAAPAAASDDFQGTDRRDAKLSIVDAQTEDFADLATLVGSLTSDDDMVNHDPPLTRDPGFERVQEEDRNVHTKGFLYAASRENDNDFHFIVGTEPGSDPTYMNMELSGLPPADSDTFDRLKAARDAYTTFVSGQTPGAGYHHYDPPIPVEVWGSLFFDITHAHGPHPGPANLRPKTIWEVHPISKIVFEP
jgi:hypothetical protein